MHRVALGPRPGGPGKWHHAPTLSYPPASRRSLGRSQARGSGANRPWQARGALAAYLRAAAAPRLRAGLRRAAPGCASWAAPRWTGLRWAARPASARLGSARALGSARLGSARRCPGRSLAAHAARGGRGAGACGGRGSGPPRGLLEAPYLGSDVRGSRRGRTTHFFPFTPQSFLSPSPGTPPPVRAPLRPAWPRRAPPGGRPAGPGCPDSRGHGEAGARRAAVPAGASRLGNPRLPQQRGGSAQRPPPCQAVSLRAPPLPPRPPRLPRCHFLPGPPGTTVREAPVAAAGALQLRTTSWLHPGPKGVHRCPQSVPSPAAFLQVPALLREARAFPGGNPL